MFLPLSAWDTLLRPIIPNCQMFKWGDLYWMNEILFIDYFELKIAINEKTNSNGRMESPRVSSLYSTLNNYLINIERKLNWKNEMKNKKLNIEILNQYEIARTKNMEKIQVLLNENQIKTNVVNENKENLKWMCIQDLLFLRSTPKMIKNL